MLFGLDLEAELALLAEVGQTFLGMTASLSYLKAIDDAGQEEIEHHKCPEATHLHGNIAKGTSHRIQTSIGPDAKGAGEQPGHTLPVAWDGRLWPRDATQEE